MIDINEAYPVEFLLLLLINIIANNLADNFATNIVDSAINIADSEILLAILNQLVT